MNRILLTALVTATACAPLDEAEIAAREYQRGEFRAKFLEYRKDCEEIGGTVVIRSHRRIRADRVARPGDRYHCEIP